jgi:uncharacterized coiled-coil DUF342 family protein
MIPDNDLKKKTKKELFADFDKLKGEIYSLRGDLNNSGSGRESWYSKKQGTSSDIRGKIKVIKQSREKRDTLTSRVKVLKEKRSKFNDDIKKKISVLNGLKKQSSVLTKKAGIKSPSQVKTAIDSLESKLETEAMSFEAEKKLSKKLKFLKKSLEEASGIMELTDKIKKMDSQLKDAKKESNSIHGEIQSLAKESQKLHENLITESKNVGALEKQEKDIFAKFAYFKKTFNEKNKILEEKLSRMSQIKSEIDKFQLEEDEKRKLQDNMIIKNKEHELEEKIKKGSKLTTEDFLAFQETIKVRK